MRQPQDDVLDVGSSPELLRLAEEVRSSGKAYVLQNNGEGLAVIRPLSANGRRKRSRQPGKPLTEQAIADFNAAAGGWADVDLDSFLADVYASRDQPGARPPVEF